LDGSTVNVIAEIKRSSPSKGLINSGIDSALQARKYEAGGAAAISVLTEPTRFGGSEHDIDQVADAVKLPILKKDFHVTEAQIVHAAMTRASGALVIVRAVTPAELIHLANVAERAGLELVFEVRDESELERAIHAGARMVGVNNRNLETLEIDRDTVSRIVPLIPKECIAIAESGYSTRSEIEDAANAGADAVLVGSSLSVSPDPEAAVRDLSSVRRRSRRGR
jgi:indole-3-glycerol phosphate synthase